MWQSRLTILAAPWSNRHLGGGGGGGGALAFFLLVSLATVQAVQKRYRCGGGGGESCLWYQALDVARLSCDGCVLVLSLVVLDAGKSKRRANGK